MSQTFRPSARVKLLLRVDELGDTRLQGQLASGLADPTGGAADSIAATVTDPPLQIAEWQDQLSDITATIAQLQRLRAEIPPDDYERSLRRAQARREECQAAIDSLGTGAYVQQTPPAAIAGAPPDDYVVLGFMLPRSAEIHRNGVRTADEATIVLDHADAPFDARIMRAAAVEIIIGVVPALEFEAGITGSTRADGSPTSIVDGAADSVIGGATRFVGVVDDWDTERSEDSTVTLRCRDMTSLLSDTKLPQGAGIDLNLPIEVGIAGLLAQIPATRGLRVRFVDEVGELTGAPSVGPVPGGTLPPSRRARRGRVARRARQAGQNTTVWEHIVDVCGMAGVVPRIDDWELRIERARTLFGNQPARVRQMVWGRNLLDLSFKRKLAGFKNPTVECRCYDPTIGRVRWARYPAPMGGIAFGVIGIVDPPTAPSRANQTTPSGANPSEKIQVYPISGVTDGATLAGIARDLFEEVARQELEGSFSTNDPASWDIDTDSPRSFDDADLLDLRAGDAVELLVRAAQPDEDGGADTASRIEGLAQASRAAYLRSLGWSDALAQRFAELQDEMGNRTIFRVIETTVKFDHDEGLSVDVSFQNLIAIEGGRGLAGQALRDGASPAVRDLTADRLEDANAIATRAASDARRSTLAQQETGAITGEPARTQFSEAQRAERDGVRSLRGEG